MTDSAVTTVIVWGTETPLDAISIAMLAASEDLRRFALAGEHGFLTYEVEGLECEIETGQEFHLSIELEDGLAVSVSHIGEKTPMIDLRYDGKNGDLVDRMREKSKTAKTLGELVTLPQILAPFAGLSAVLDDFEGPDWDGWCSMTWTLSGDALLPETAPERDPAKAA
tara:strand:+ start:3048 stop:3551 length:504 start_codon:yes stop_codon:yes gene_type:complete